MDHSVERHGIYKNMLSTSSGVKVMFLNFPYLWPTLFYESRYLSAIVTAHSTGIVDTSG